MLLSQIDGYLVSRVPHSVRNIGTSDRSSYDRRSFDMQDPTGRMSMIITDEASGDAWMRVRSTTGMTLENVVAVGDVACFRPAVARCTVRFEHRTSAVEQSAVAASTRVCVVDGVPDDLRLSTVYGDGPDVVGALGVDESARVIGRACSWRRGS